MNFSDVAVCSRSLGLGRVANINFNFFLFFLTDINECLDENLCVGGQCLNTDGSYMCFCTHPMVLDPNRSRCVLVPEVAGKFEWRLHSKIQEILESAK